jgi:hypothetical protein
MQGSAQVQPQGIRLENFHLAIQRGLKALAYISAQLGRLANGGDANRATVRMAHLTLPLPLATRIAGLPRVLLDSRIIQRLYVYP